MPYPLLGENTLVLSDSMVLAKDEKGTLALMFRCVLFNPILKIVQGFIGLLIHNRAVKVQGSVGVGELGFWGQISLVAGV